MISYKKLILAFAVLGFVATAQAQDGGASNSVGLSVGTVFPFTKTNVNGEEIKAGMALLPPALGLSGEYAVTDAFTVEGRLHWLKTKFETGEGDAATEKGSSNRLTLFVGGNYYIALDGAVMPYVSFDLGYSMDMAKVGSGDSATSGTVLAPAGQAGFGLDYSLGSVNLGLQGNFVALGGAKYRRVGTEEGAATESKVLSSDGDGDADVGFFKKFVYGVGVALTVKMPL